MPDAPAIAGVEDIFEEFLGNSPHPRRFSEERESTEPEPPSAGKDDSRDETVRGLVEREGTLLTAATQTAEIYQQCVACVLESIRRADGGAAPDVENGKRLVKGVIDSVSNGSELLLAATQREQEFAVSTHSVNVTILAVKLAHTLRFNATQRVQVGLAGLVHEIGIVKLPETLLHKAGKLTGVEAELLRRRAAFGAEILKGLGAEYDWLIEIVEQVFEREDGTGFPRGLTGKNIREESKVVAMADVFEACIHDRPYRRALTGYQAVLELTSEGTRSFSDRIVKALLRAFSLYPYNEYVVLNTGEIARVVDINQDNLFRPSVSILYDREGGKLEEPRLTNLTENPSLYVSKAITAASLPQS